MFVLRFFLAKRKAEITSDAFEASGVTTNATRKVSTPTASLKLPAKHESDLMPE